MLNPTPCVAADELTDDQARIFAAVWGDVSAHAYPGEGQEDLRSEALSGAVQYLLGEATLGTAAARLTAARAAEAASLAAAKGAALAAIEGGVDEQDAAREVGVNRTTLRRAAGKQPMSQKLKSRGAAAW